MVGALLKDDHAAAVAESNVPSSGQVWWRAQVRARAEAERAAARPIFIAQAVAAAALVGLIAAVVSWVWPKMSAAGACSTPPARRRSWARWRGSRLAPGSFWRQWPYTSCSQGSDSRHPLRTDRAPARHTGSPGLGAASPAAGLGLRPRRRRSLRRSGSLRSRRVWSASKSISPTSSRLTSTASPGSLSSRSRRSTSPLQRGDFDVSFCGLEDITARRTGADRHGPLLPVPRGAHRSRRRQGPLPLARRPARPLGGDAGRDDSRSSCSSARSRPTASPR